MTLGERIKKVRKESDLTQRDFGAQIGTTQNAIASYEIGRREPSATAINNICKTFNVREAWLRTGEGEMFEKRSEEDELSAMVERLITGESAAFKKRLVNALSTLKDEHWLLLEAKLKEIVDMRTADPAVDSKREATPQTEPDIMSELAELKQQYAEKDKQLQELSARLAAIEEEEESDWPSDTGNLA